VVNNKKQTSVAQQPPDVFTRLEKDSSTGNLERLDKPIHSNVSIEDAPKDAVNATLKLYDELDNQSALNSEKTAPKVYQNPA
jgi:hypothetical protein